MGGVVPKPFRPRPKPTPTPVAAPTPAPTTAEVSQSTATSMDGYDSMKTKRKGRSATVLTGPRGVEDETLTLGRRSLLGR